MKKLSQGLALLLACILLFQCGISSVYAEDILPDGSDAGSANISVDADKDDQQPEDEQQGDTPDEDDQKPEDEQQGDTPDEDDQQPEDEQQGDTPDESDQQPEDEQQGDTPDEDDQKPEDEQQGDTPDEDDQQPEDELSAVPMLLGAAPPAQSNGGIGQWGTSSQADGDGVHLIVGWYEPDGDKSSRPESVAVTVYWKTPDHVIHTGTVTLHGNETLTDVDTMERDLGVYEAKDYEGKIDRWKTWPNYTPEGSTTPQGKDHQKGVTYDFPDIPGYNVKIIDGDCGVIYIKADQTDKTGSIIIDKQTVGEVGTPENAVFVVTDFNTGEVKETIKYSDFTQVGNDEDHRQYTLENLPLGTYKITERGAEQNGYVLTVKGSKAGHNDIQYENDNSSENKGKFEWNSGPEASANNNNSKKEDIAYIRNTYEKSKTFIELQATKSYENGTLTDEQFTFKLMEGNVQVSTATNDENGSIKFPKIYYKEAGTYTYTISEVAGDSSDGIIYDSKSYNVTVTVTGEGEKLTATADQDYLENGITFTNTYNRTTVSGSKTWNDNNNQDGIRPESITIRLYADGEEKDYKTVSADTNGNWSWTFANLDKYANGQEINYSISEDQVAGYTAAYDGTNVTNTHTPETTFVSGTKTWNDNNNQDGIRPTSITINLLANEEKIDSKEVTADDDWSWTFDDLPKYANGQEIKYTITEDAVTGYTSEVKGYNVTNTHTPEKTSVTGSKTWNDNDNQDGMRPESIMIRLYADGEQVDSKEVKATDNWSWTFANLPKYADGKEITYSIREDQVDNYTSAVNGYDVTNTHTPEKTSVSGSKTWDDNDDQDGIRPESIMIRLYAGDQLVRSQTVTAANGWTWNFADLPVYKAGQKITYTITEDEVTGYTSVVSGYNVTNTHTPEKTSVTGTKTWNDNNDQDGMRPESITIRLYADGVEVDSKEVKATDNWSWTFDDLDKYADGKEITYTITEDEVEDYTAEIDGYDVTNTYDPVMPFSHDGNGGRKTGVTPEPSKTPETSAASHAGVEAPTTGDTSALGAWSFSAAMALALLAVVVWRKRANDRRRDEMQ